MENSNKEQLEAAQKKIAHLESQLDKLKEVVLQMAWELEHRHKHQYITKMEEEFLQNRRRTG